MSRASRPPGSLDYARDDGRSELAQSSAVYPLKSPKPLNSAFCILHSAFRFLLLLLLACHKEPAPPIVLISVDTLRADRVRAELTPNILALARDGVMFDNTWSHVPLTLPSHTTIFTGLLPASNGVRDNAGYALDETIPTLASILAANGYTTGGAVSSYVLRKNAGIARGFDFFDDDTGDARDITASRPGEQTLASLTKWLNGTASKKVFCFLHLYDPHAPYRAPAQFQKAGRSDYDAAVAYADDSVGKFIADLKQRGLYDRAIIVLLSDHGEGLGDHGELDHGVFVYREALQVPLIVKLPDGERGKHIASLAALTDVTPTILGAAGIAIPQHIDGVDLLHAKLDDHRQVDAESYYGRLHLHWQQLTSVITARYQYIQAPQQELYDLPADPQETTNVMERERRTGVALAQALAARTKPLTAPSHVDDEDQRKLASLGYVSSGPLADEASYPDPKERIRYLTMYRHAERLARAGGTVAAIPMLKTVTHDAPEILDAWILLSRAMETTGHIDESIAVLRDTQRHFADNPSVSLALASALLRSKRLAEAEATASGAVSQEPVLAHELLARIELARGNAAEARKQAESALAAAPHRAASLLTLAQVEKASGDWQAMLAALDRAAERSGSIRGLQADRGEALLRLQRGAEAEEAYRKEVERFPDNLESWGNLAVILAAQGRNAEAREVVQRAVSLNPGPAAEKMAKEATTVIR